MTQPRNYCIAGKSVKSHGMQKPFDFSTLGNGGLDRSTSRNIPCINNIQLHVLHFLISKRGKDAHGVIHSGPREDTELCQSKFVQTLQGLCVSCLLSKQHTVSISQGQRCKDTCMCYHTEIEVANLTQS